MIVRLTIGFYEPYTGAWMCGNRDYQFNDLDGIDEWIQDTKNHMEKIYGYNGLVINWTKVI